MKSKNEKIVIKGARQHNLKNIDVEIIRNKLVVVTGLSGSGKSSLAFDTLYAEGQRRYVESLSSYARQFLGLMEKPDIDYIEGLSPAISIEQKASARNPRSTVGTVTEIHDYLRLLYANIGKPHCWLCNRPIQKQTVQQIVDSIMRFKKDSKINILAPVIRGRKGEHKTALSDVKREGFLRVRINGEIKNIDDKIKLAKNKKHTIEIVIDRLILDEDYMERLTESVELALKIGSGMIIIHELPNNDHVYSEHFACPHCEVSMEELSARMFSFNSPYGACSNCDGLGSHMEIDPEMVVPDKTKSIIQGAILPLGEQPRGNWYGSVLKSLSEEYNFNFTTPWYKLDPKVREILLMGTGVKKLKMKYSSTRWSGTYTGGWEGVISNLMRRYKQTKSNHIRDWIEQFMSMKPCPKCSGSRLKKESRAVTISETSIGQLSSYPIKEIKEFFDRLKLNEMDSAIADQIIKEIKKRISFLIDVGLDYLNLNRQTRSLSGGESQRIRLATQIGSQLQDVLYILDEPSIGLHQIDNTKLIKSLKKLRDLDNSVIVVEHDKEIMLQSDYIIDIGPGAGKNGGKIVFKGSYSDIINSNSITAEYLNSDKIILKKNIENKNDKFLILSGCNGNNLKNITLKLPLGKIVGICGVSGSGKSSLINQTLYPILNNHFFNGSKEPLPYKKIEGLENIDKVIQINQSPIGRTPRSNPATYTGLYNEIRDLFSKLPESSIRGYKPGRFSFNVKGGRCEECTGAGMKKIEMNFLPDVFVECDECNGKRFNKETLSVKFKNKSISDILDMTIKDAADLFTNYPKIIRKLNYLNKVGLGYITLGQQSTTLSGGESQRIKLATELSKKDTGKTMYIFDEPTTGLHFEDIKVFLDIIFELSEKGNSIIIIEHNIDVLKVSDYIIELGPNGGKNGGKITFQGKLNEIFSDKKSITGQFIKKELNL